jgi:hypothetical protein
MMTNTYTSGPCALALLVLTFGCTQDQVGTFDASVDEDMGQTSEVGPGADAGDIAEDADGGTDGGPDDGGDTNPDADGGSMEEDANLGIDADPVPDEPAAQTHCNDENWCWVHPSPFPHRITELQQVGDRVFGVASASRLRGRQRVIWDGTSLELLSKPVPPGEFLQDMTTSNDGWLALDDDGVVYDLGPEGERGTRDLPSGEHRTISGTSLDSFIVHGEYAEAYVMRGGRLVTQSLPEDMQRQSVMWPNGDISGLRLPMRDPVEYLDGTWRIFPAPEVTDYPALGPAPGSDCSSEGIFTATEEAGLYRWDEIGMAFAAAAYDGSMITTIDCSPDGELLLTNVEGRVLTRTGEAVEPWHSRTIVDRRIEDAEVQGSTLHVSSVDGEHAIVSAGQRTHLGGGFRVPQADLPEDLSSVFTGFGIHDAGEEMILSHTSGTYRGTDSGWRRMPIADEDLNYKATFDRIHRAHGTLFAMSDSRLWRWEGDRWVNITESALGTQQANASHSRVGPEGNLWLWHLLDLFRYDGDSWTNLTAEGTPLEESLDASDLRIDSVFASHDGDVVVSTDSATHTLSRQMDEWTLTKRRDVPCEDLNAYHDTADGAVWIVGDGRRCVAGFVDGEWTTYDLPPEQMRPPESFGPETATFLPQPGSDVPLLANEYGLLEPRPDGTLKPEFIGQFLDAIHLPSKGASFALTRRGVIAKYHE